MSKVFSFSPDKLESLIAMDPEEGKDFVASLIDRFLGNTPKAIQDTEADLKAGRFTHIKGSAHKLKSTCGNLGLNSLMELAIEIEKQAGDCQEKQLEPSQLGKTLEEFKAHLEQSRAVLVKYAKNAGGS